MEEALKNLDALLNRAQKSGIIELGEVATLLAMRDTINETFRKCEELENEVESLKPKNDGIVK